MIVQRNLLVKLKVVGGNRVLQNLFGRKNLTKNLPCKKKIKRKKKSNFLILKISFFHHLISTLGNYNSKQNKETTTYNLSKKIFFFFCNWVILKTFTELIVCTFVKYINSC